MSQLSGTAKADFVGRMFGRIARRYDLLNSMMSLCQAQRWRRAAAELAAPRPGAPSLDIATGTGDLALELARLGRGSVVASDFSDEMLVLAQNKANDAGLVRRMQFVLADAHALPFPDGAFACATVAFGVRNFTNPHRAFAELRRVVDDDGRIVCLELVHPDGGAIASMYNMYLQRVVPALGHWVSGDGEAYRYLPDSVQSFMTARQLQDLMADAGLKAVRYHTLNLGTVAVHIGIK